MDIKHDLLPAQKSRKYNLKETIDLYPITTELYDELGRIGIIDRIKDIPQLGVIKVKKKLNKSSSADKEEHSTKLKTLLQ